MTIITRSRGDTYPDEITVTHEATGGAINVIGCTFTLTVDPSKAPVDASANVYSISGVITDAVNGKVQFAPSAVQADQAPGTYYYDIQMVDATGAKRTLGLDKYIYTQDITKT